jgi:hypothetical protein
MSADLGKTPPQRQRRRREPSIDLSSETPVEYAGTFVPGMGWSPSTGKRRKPFLPVYSVLGFPKDMIVPAQARAVMRNEQPRRGRGRPRRGDSR